MINELAVRTVKQRYFHGVDSKDWALYGSVFDDEAELDMSGATYPPHPPIIGRAAIVEFVTETLSEFTTTHRGFLRELEFDAPGRARALWAMEDILWRGEPGHLTKALHGYGHYHERYAETGGVWRITSCRLTRVHVDFF